MTRINNTKTTPQGGRVNPKTVPDGYVSRFAPMTDVQLEEAMQEAATVAQAVHEGVEWMEGTVIGDFMFKWTGQAAMSPVLKELLATSPVIYGTTAQQAAQFVRMDHPATSALALIHHANINNWDIHQSFERCQPPHVDFITRQIDALEYMYTGLSEAMDAGFIEKQYWEDKGHARPEEYFCNIGPLATAYPEGAPCHNERPAGHGVFCGYLSRRAQHFYNGHDLTIETFFLQVAFSRVLSFMHIGQSCEEGYILGHTA